MPRTAASAPLNTQRARSRLAPQRLPYWRGIRQGLRLGWLMKPGEPAGTWLVRVAWPKYSTTKTTIGTADDGVLRADGVKVFSYDQAVDWAVTFANKVMSGDSPVRPAMKKPADITIGEALENYSEGKTKARRPKQASEGETLRRRHLPDWLAGMRVVDARREHMVQWLSGLKSLKGDEPLSQDRVDFLRTIMRAALRATQGTPEEVLEGLRDAAMIEARGFRQEAAHNNIVLDRAQRAGVLQRGEQLVGIDFALFAGVLDVTGVRPGMLSRCLVSDLDVMADGRSLLSIPRSAKGRPGVQKHGRIFAPIPKTLTARILARVRELNLRSGEQLLGRARMVNIGAALWKEEGRTEWEKTSWGRAWRLVAESLAADGQPLDPEATIYSLRHTRICAWIEAGLSTTEIGQRTDTSAKMIEMHYARELARRAHAQDRMIRLQDAEEEIYAA